MREDDRPVLDGSFPYARVLRGGTNRGGRQIMSETQSITEPKVENSVNGSAAPAHQADASAAAPATKAPFIETLRERGTSWAGVAIGYGRIALEQAARVLDRTAGRLGELQEKLKKGDVAAAEGAR
ncbi:hypothetical protein SCE1572_11225 [Sorangium cellulosum So0157-2]|nr:hypothetical protein SCE1572_11225 [Sorangium cellulosum So0157-2]